MRGRRRRRAWSTPPPPGCSTTTAPSSTPPSLDRRAARPGAGRRRRPRGHRLEPAPGPALGQRPARTSATPSGPARRRSSTTPPTTASTSSPAPATTPPPSPSSAACARSRPPSYGNPVTYTPEDRAANALDGDPLTAWRVGALAPVEGERLVVTLDQPVTTDHLTLLQPTTGPRNRWITKVRLRFDGGDTLDVDPRRLVACRARPAHRHRPPHVPHARADRHRRQLRHAARLQRPVGGGRRRARASATRPPRWTRSCGCPTDLLAAAGAGSADHRAHGAPHPPAGRPARADPLRPRAGDGPHVHPARRPHVHRRPARPGSPAWPPTPPSTPPSARPPARSPRRRRPTCRASRACGARPRSTATRRRRGRRRSPTSSGQTLTVDGGHAGDRRPPRPHRARRRPPLGADGARAHAPTAARRSPSPCPPVADDPTHGERHRDGAGRPAGAGHRSIAGRRPSPPSAPVQSPDDVSGEPTDLPVGIAELGAAGFTESAPAGAPPGHLPLRPPDASTASPVPVRVTGTVAAAVARQPLAVEPCGAPLDAGRRRRTTCAPPSGATSASTSTAWCSTRPAPAARRRAAAGAAAAGAAPSP